MPLDGRCLVKDNKNDRAFFIYEGSIDRAKKKSSKSYSVWYIAIFIFILHDKFLNNFKTIQQMVADYIAPARSNI